MLPLSSVPLALPSALVPFRLENSTVLTDLKSEVTHKDKVFCIGADKTGTTTLAKLFNEMPGDWNSCHGTCPKPWFSDKKKDSVEFEKHRAFMDNGDMADFEWLDSEWGHARFVLNQRALEPWMLSRFDMMKEIRLNGGCSPIGDLKSCKTGRLTSASGHDGAHSTFVANDEESMRQWVIEVAESQNKIKKYFSKDEQRKNRFVAVDLCDAPASATLMRLFWAVRTNLHEHTTEHLMTTEQHFGEKTHNHFENLAKHSSVKLGHENSRSHKDESAKHINAFLKKHGCSSHGADLWYHDCAEKIKKHKESLASAQ